MLTLVAFAPLKRPRKLRGPAQLFMSPCLCMYAFIGRSPDGVTAILRIYRNSCAQCNIFMPWERWNENKILALRFFNHQMGELMNPSARIVDSTHTLKLPPSPTPPPPPPPPPPQSVLYFPTPMQVTYIIHGHQHSVLCISVPVEAFCVACYN